MNHDAKTQFDVKSPPHSEDGELDRLRGKLAEHAQQRITDARQRAERTAALREKERQAVAEIFGGKAEQYRKECAEWRAKNPIARTSFEGKPDAATIAAVKQASAQGKGALQRLGVDAGRLAEVRKKTRAAIEALHPTTPAGSPPAKWLPEAQVPDKIKNHNTPPWVLRTPPYDGWQWWYSQSWNGGTPSVEGYLDSNTGDVGHRSSWSLNDSDDYDYCQTEQGNHMGIWHWTDVAGPVEVWAKARCAITRSYILAWEDFWQWSSSYITQRDYFSCCVSPINTDASLGQIWGSTLDMTEDDFYQDWTPAASNNVYWLYVQTTQPIPANAWTWIQIGSRGSHYAYANDTSTGVILQGRWFLEEIYYRVVAP